MSKESIWERFDPNAPGLPGKLFGLPYDEETADIILLPVPWEVTVSYGAGTSDGPEAILQASGQIDLCLRDIPEVWKLGIWMAPVSPSLKTDNLNHRDLAVSYIRWLESSDRDGITPDMKVIPGAIDELCEKLHIFIRTQAEYYLKRNRIVGTVGGDHSTPLGLMRALSGKYPEFGILQIDAHADLRKSYEDFTYSHASIMYHALQLRQVTRLVQVGVRDYCEEELGRIRADPQRIRTYFDEDLKGRQFAGESWSTISESIISSLPEYVYLSVDADGLDPRYCPNTGTPVPGGPDFDQVVYLFKALVRSGRKIIGFDLSEVSPGDSEWDANVGARLLFHMCSLAGASQQRLQLKQ